MIHTSGKPGPPNIGEEDTSSISEYVSKIQQSLNEINKSKPGYKPLKEDKNFGPLTKAAVSAFQKEYGLLMGTNGVIGQETIQQLDNLAALIEPQPLAGNLPEVTVIGSYTGDDKEITRDDVHIDPRIKTYALNLQAQSIIYTIQKLYKSKENPDPRLLKEPQKKQEFKNSSENTTAILLLEYLTGKGPRDRNFDESFPFTKDIMRGLSTARAYGELYKKIKESKIEEGKEYSFYVGYGSSEKETFAAKVRYHANSRLTDNIAEFYRGGMTYFFIVENDEIRVRVVDHYETNSGSGAGYIIDRVVGKVTPMGQTNLELTWKVNAGDVLLDYKGLKGKY